MGNTNGKLYAKDYQVLNNKLYEHNETKNCMLEKKLLPETDYSAFEKYNLYIQAKSACIVENNYKKKIEELIKKSELEKESQKKIIEEYKLKISKIEKDLSVKQASETEKNEGLKMLEKTLNDKNQEIKHLENVNSIFHQELEDSYDIIIDASSLTALESGKGWEIKFSEEGREKYNKYKDQNQVVVGVIGNFKKGKSFILQKLSEQNIAQGFSVTTKGLSIKYPPNENCPIAILDTAGFETPIRYIEKNYDDRIDNQILELLKDRTHTEIFLQKYIIRYSDILLIVVGDLTYSEQKLINRLKALADKKKLIVVHNLLTFTEVREVENYVKNTLKNSFLLTENKIIEDISKNGIDSNDSPNCYWEEIVRKNECSINHVILAKENTHAGNKYNKSSITYLKDMIKTTDRRPFDPIENMKTHIYERSKDMFEADCQISDINKIKCQQDGSTEKLYIDKMENVVLTKCYVDELGISNYQSSGFLPDHSIYKFQDTLAVKLDVPDLDLDRLDIQPIDTQGNSYRLLIKGEKIDNDTDASDKLINNRKKGYFNITLIMSKEGLNFKSLEPIALDYDCGVIKITYSLVNEKGNMFNVKDLLNKSKK